MHFIQLQPFISGCGNGTSGLLKVYRPLKPGGKPIAVNK
jgi:hypothetical protein